MSKTPMRGRAACTLLIACVGLILVNARSRHSVPDGGVPIRPEARLAKPELSEHSGPVASARPVTTPRNDATGTMFSHGGDDDQPAGACWLASLGGTPPSCVCSAGSVEDLLTPGFMRVLLTNWRDAGLLTRREWRERLQEVDAACGPQAVAP